MGQGITLFAQLQARLPWSALDRAVAALAGDYKVQRATCRSHFLVLLLAMLRRQHSLRHIETGLSGRRRYLAAFGVGSVDRSTISHANRCRPAAVAEAMYQALLRRTQAVAPGDRFRGKRITLDATVVQVSATLFEWARCAPEESGIKLHLFLDHNGLLPCWVEFGTLRNSELEWARRRTYAPGTVLCFDQGYFDTAWLAALQRQGVTFVTRLPPRPVYDVVRERAVGDAPGVLADEIVRFRSRICRRQYPRPLRLVTFCDPLTGNLLWFLTNQMTWSAATVCRVYKDRWQIELFFKWLKQHVNLTHFYGRDENAVRWQVLVALCLYLLLAGLKFEHGGDRSLCDWLRALDHYLFDHRTLENLWLDIAQQQT
jgi:hypothetical protein